MQIKILGYTYNVEFLDNNALGNSARLSANEQRIMIGNNSCPEQQLSGLLHEIIEAINYHLELEMKHNVIMSLEASLFQVLEDNGVDLGPLMKWEKKHE